MTDSSKKNSSLLRLTIRLYWFFWGFFPLFLSLKFISDAKGAYTFFDLIFLFFLFSLLAVRYADIRWFEGETVNCEKATIKDFYSYSIKIIGVFVSAWLLIHFFL